MCCRCSWLAALFMALLVTFPSLTLAAGSVTYLGADPALRLSLSRRAAQSGQGRKDRKPPRSSGRERAERPEQPVIRPSFKAKP